MNWFKTLLAKFAGPSHVEETPMTVVEDATTAAPATTDPTVLSTDTLQALLSALGHNIETADWERLIALSTKPA